MPTPPVEEAGFSNSRRPPRTPLRHPAPGSRSGVETDIPEIAGGKQYTFYEEGSAVLGAETAKVRAAFSALPGYDGVTVEHLHAWKNLRP
jgi:hypothetical protein